MTRLLGFFGLLLLTSGFLLAAQCAYDLVRGETAVRTERFSSPRIIARSTEAKEFELMMTLHWFVAAIPALAGWFLLRWARREESLDMFSPDFKCIDLLEEAGETKEPEDPHETLPPPAHSSVPMNIPVGRVLSVLICVAYVGVAFASGPVLLRDMAAVYALLAGCLMLIWCPDEIGDATGYYVGHHGLVDRPTPGILISCAGWFFLVGLPVLFWFLNR